MGLWDDHVAMLTIFASRDLQPCVDREVQNLHSFMHALEGDMWRLGTLCAVAISVCGGFANASTIDQSNPPTLPRVLLNDSFEWQQQVTAGVSGPLSGIELFGSSPSDLVRIALGNAFSTGPFIFSATVNLTKSGVFIDTSAANIELTAGDTFVIDVSQGGDCCNLLGATDGYSGGDIYFNYPPYAVGLDYTHIDPSTPYTMSFVTYMGTGKPDYFYSQTPEPTIWAMMLIGFGGVGIAMRNVRRRNSFRSLPA